MKNRSHINREIKIKILKSNNEEKPLNKGTF